MKTLYFNIILLLYYYYSIAHGVSGEVFAINDKTLRLKNFNYDGQAPTAYFWAGNSAGNCIT